MVFTQAPCCVFYASDTSVMTGAEFSRSLIFFSSLQLEEIAGLVILRK